MNRFFQIPTFVALAGLMFGVMPTTQAAFMTGTQGMSDTGTPTIGGASTTTLAAATTFTFGNLVTTTAETGSFLTTPSFGQTLAATTLDLANPTSFTLGNSVFGTFTASTITTLFSSAQSRSFYVLGTFISGTSFGATTTNPASFTVSFTQTGGAGSAISDSSTLSVPPGTVPEPASLAMLGLGLAGIAGYTARRRRTR